MTTHLLGSLLATAGLDVRAQPGRMARLGVVEYGAAPDSALTRGYLEALAALGWREGTTLGVERRFASGHPERFAELLRELAAQPVDLVFAPGHDIAKVAKTVIAQTSVVTVGSEDPIRSGLIGSFSQPGGSVTGVSYMSPLPAVSAYDSFAEAGGLMTYGADTGEALKRAAAQTDRILKGARPADVPFELPTRFRLTLNLKTASAVGLAIPAAIVLRADRVIE